MMDLAWGGFLTDEAILSGLLMVVYGNTLPACPWCFAIIDIIGFLIISNSHDRLSTLS